MQLLSDLMTCRPFENSCILMTFRAASRIFKRFVFNYVVVFVWVRLRARLQNRLSWSRNERHEEICILWVCKFYHVKLVLWAFCWRWVKSCDDGERIITSILGLAWGGVIEIAKMKSFRVFQLKLLLLVNQTKEHSVQGIKIFFPHLNPTRDVMRKQSPKKSFVPNMFAL